MIQMRVWRIFDLDGTGEHLKNFVLDIDQDEKSQDLKKLWSVKSTSSWEKIYPPNGVIISNMKYVTQNHTCAVHCRSQDAFHSACLALTTWWTVEGGEMEEKTMIPVPILRGISRGTGTWDAFNSSSSHSDAGFVPSTGLNSEDPSKNRSTPYQSYRQD